MGNRLKGKVAIVTGGGAGIGEAISKKFAKEGASVVVAGLPEDPVEDVVRGIQEEGGTAIPFTGDLSSLANAKSCVELAVKQYGKLDMPVRSRKRTCCLTSQRKHSTTCSGITSRLRLP